MSNVIPLRSQEKIDVKKGYALINYYRLTELATSLPARGKSTRLVYYFVSFIQPGNLIYKNASQIAQEMEITLPTMKKYIDLLVEKGFIKQLYKSRANFWVNSLYVIKEKHMYS